ncbi:hypothetical protein ACW9HQ_43425, partial [Nocardia gipuzkoensis]
MTDRLAPTRPSATTPSRPKISGSVRSWLPPLLVGVILLAAWQLLTTAAGVPSYLLPSPSAIWEALRANAGNVTGAALATGMNALVGLLAGAVLGIVAATVAVRFRMLDGLLGPLAAAAAAIPIVALAPLLNSMYSTTTDL